MNIIQWIEGLGLTMPGLSWFKYVVAAVLFFIIFDAFLNLIFAGIHTLMSGGRK